VACAVIVVLLWRANDEHESAREDPLTTLLNRKGFDERWDETLERVRGGRQNAVLVAIDLDGFKAVNDGFGHDAGDVVIRATADRLRAAVRYTDTVARQGGDEFLLILSGVPDVATALSIAERVHEGICAPVKVNRGSVSVGASLGVLFLDGPPDTTDALELADRAMYEAKRGGGGIAFARGIG
jgi:diguanylate cyclase (GGDEF)-like protein